MPKYYNLVLTFPPKIAHHRPNSTQTMRKRYLLGLIALCAALTIARADIIPTLDPNPPAATVGGFTWNYTVNVTLDQMVTTGDYFTIYDFGAFTAGSNLQPVDWTFSSSLVGITPSQVLPTDNPNILNLTWTYNGTESITGAQLLGSFSVITDTNQLRTSDFAAEATRSNGDNAGSKVDNIGRISVPVPEMSTLLPIVSVCGAALLASIPGYLRRRKLT
jgi:hypothetical protein